MKATLSDRLRWLAVKHRDASADGEFVYAVKTTGVYCRPQCHARLARRVNVEFFGSPAEAERAGYRACLKCRPGENETGRKGVEHLVVQACETMDRADPMPTLGQLARAAGLSPFYFQRVFKKRVGVSPKAYAMARRAERLRAGLAENPGKRSATAAIFTAGYHSSGRAYADARANLGMTPGAFGRGGAGEAIRYAVVRCSLGSVAIAATDRGVCMIELGDSRATLDAAVQARFPRALLTKDDAAFTQWVERVLALIESPHPGAFPAELPLDIRGTAFQRRVWEALRAIPPGTTATYAEVARQLGQPNAVRAVAGACAANRLAIAIPCHRVVRSDGSLSGYRWGAQRKRRLIDLERSKRESGVG